MNNPSLHFTFKHPVTGNTFTVALCAIDIINHMGEAEVLSHLDCGCEPIGETNVVDCNCDEMVEEYVLDNIEK